MISVEDYYKTTHKTSANSKDFELVEQDFDVFPKEGIYIGEFESVTDDKLPALIDLCGTKGNCFLYNSKENRRLINNCLERIAWRIALSLPVGLCEFLIYDGGFPGENFGSLNRLPNSFFRSSQNVLFDADSEEFTKNLSNIYRELATKQYAIKDSGKNTISEMNDSEVSDAKIKYTFVFISDFPHVTAEQRKLVSKIVAASCQQSGVFVLLSWDMDAKWTDDMDVKRSNDIDYQCFLDNMTLLFPKGNRYCFINSADDDLMNKYVLKLDERSVSKAEWDAWLNVVNHRVEEASSKTEDLRKTVITPAMLWTKKSKEGLDIPIGLISSKELMNLMLCTPGKSEQAHGLVVGTSGSGKSSLLHNIIINGAWLYSPEELQFVLVDLKNVEFNIYSKLPHVKVLSGNAGRKYGASILAYISEVMEQREKDLAEVNAVDIEDYKNKGYSLPRILVIIDEFQVLFQEQGNTGDTRESNITSQIDKNVMNILTKARSNGIHLIVAPNNADSISKIDNYLNYLPVRIVMHMNDKGKWLAMDNSARVDQLSAGKGVYNDNFGVLKDGDGNVHNYIFRGAYYANPKVKEPTHRDIIQTEMIEPIRKKSKEVFGKEEPFEKYICIGGGKSILKDVATKVDLERCVVFVGSPITVRPGQEDVSFTLKPKRGSNMLIVGANSNYFKSLVRLTISQIIKQSTDQIRCFACYSLNDDFDADTLGKEKIEFFSDQEGLRSALETLMHHLHNRQNKKEKTSDRIILALVGLWFFKDVIKNDTEVRNNLEEIIIKGPENGIHTLLHSARNSDFQNVFEKDMMAFGTTPSISPEELKREFSIQMELKGEDRLFTSHPFYLDSLQEDYFANIRTKEGGEITEFSIYKN